MAASVVRDRITWPQGSISHETAQFGRFTNLNVMPRIAKNEAYPNALRTRQPVNHSPATIVMKIFSLGGTAPAPPPHYVDFGITTFCANRLKGTDSLFGNFYTLFHLFLSIFRDFQHTSPVLGPELLGTGRVSRTRRGFEAPL